MTPLLLALALTAAPPAPAPAPATTTTTAPSSKTTTTTPTTTTKPLTLTLEQRKQQLLAERDAFVDACAEKAGKGDTTLRYVPDPNMAPTPAATLAAHVFVGGDADGGCGSFVFFFGERDSADDAGNTLEVELRGAPGAPVVLAPGAVFRGSTEQPGFSDGVQVFLRSNTLAKIGNEEQVIGRAWLRVGSVVADGNGASVDGDVAACVHNGVYVGPFHARWRSTTSGWTGAPTTLPWSADRKALRCGR